MKKLSVLLLIITPLLGQAQSKAMKNLSDQYPDGRVFMFYHSSLNMLNIEDDPEFSKMIQDIEKIKVLMIESEEQTTKKGIVAELKDDLDSEGFEELMTVQSKDYDVGVYILEDDGEVEGFFFVMEEGSNLVAVDLIGSMPINDIGKLMEKIQEAKDF